MKDAGLEMAAGVLDPFGGSGATQVRNRGEGAGEIGQRLPVPAAFQYAVSVYVRSEGEERIRLFAEAGATRMSQEFRIGPAWRRVVHSVRLGGAEEEVRFGLSVPGGAVVELYGAQVEAQAGASAYKRSGAGGVYESARFAEDVLKVNTDGPGLHSASVRIQAAG
jgi:hypothetical protein